MYVSEFKAIFEDALRSLGGQLKIVGHTPPEKIAEAMMKIQKYIPMERDPEPSADTSAAEIKKSCIMARRTSYESRQRDSRIFKNAKINLRRMLRRL